MTGDFTDPAWDPFGEPELASVPEVIKGDFINGEDTEITVEPYDDGLALLVIGVSETVFSGEAFNITLTREKALKLARLLIEATGDDHDV